MGTVIVVLGIVSLALALAAFIFPRFRRNEYDTSPPKLWDKPGIALLALALLLIFFGAGTVTVSPTEMAVLENSVTGELSVLTPGTYVWPFYPRTTPFITHAVTYDMRRQIIEIGGQDLKAQGVQADSNSPGRPVVYFWARGWTAPNPEKLTTLHKRYGAKYADDWVERVWVSSLKAVQGQNPYDYVGNNRIDMQDGVEAALQTQLLDDDGEPLVFVSQLAIVDFGYDDALENYLNEINAKEFQRKQAEQQIAINSLNQQAEKIAADTRFINATRDAEGAAQVLQTAADAEAYQITALADANAYQIKVEYDAKADGIALLIKALGGPEAYLKYVNATQWDGKLPFYMFGETPLPFLNVPTNPPAP